MSTPRSQADIFHDLLAHTVKNQWRYNAVYLGDGEYEDGGCPECSQYKPPHLDRCSIAKLIAEAQECLVTAREDSP